MLLTAALLALLPQGPASSTAPVVINEINYDDYTDPDFREFVELYNRSSAPVDIGGWKLDAEDWQGATANNQDFFVSPGTILAPGAYYVMATPGAVPIIDQVVMRAPTNRSGVWEGADEGLSLRDASGNIVDTIYYEEHYVALGGFVPPRYLIEGQGIWGSNIAPPFEPMSWQRLWDGYDTNNNGHDFALAPFTAGTTNNAPSILPYSLDTSPSAGSEIVEWKGDGGVTWFGSLPLATLEDPGQVTLRNPSVIPPSPAGSPGSRVMVVWQSLGRTGCGVAQCTDAAYSMLRMEPVLGVALEAWAYFDATPEATDPNTGISEGEYWSLGVQGHSGNLSEFPDIHATLGDVRNGETGVTLTYIKDDQGATLYLIDNNDGGIDHTVLGQVAVLPGVNDGWQRIRLEAGLSWARANFGGTYGLDDGVVIEGPIAGQVGGVYLATRTLRGGGATSITPRPFTADALEIRAFDSGLTRIGSAVPSSVGLSDLFAFGFPQLGNAAFALELAGMVPSSPFALLFGFDPQSGTPIDLAPLGAQPGAVLYFAPTATLGATSGPSGAYELGLPIPHDPAMAGERFWVQQFQVDLALAASLPLAHSPGLGVVIQPF